MDVADDQEASAFLEAPNNQSGAAAAAAGGAGAAGGAAGPAQMSMLVSNPENMPRHFTGRPAATKRTTKYLTKYERARILGTRALQISHNAPILVNLTDEIDPLQIAERELREKKIPMIIRRYLPDGTYEDWRLDELIID